MISASNQSQCEIYIHILRSIVDTALLCGKQNISLRGHRDTFSDDTLTVSNKGNFLAILQLMASNDSLLQTHLNSCLRNASYTSNTIQNEIIDIIGDQIRTSMTECLSQDDAFFAIIADEVTDVHANQEVLSVCLRFLDNLNPEQPEVKEVFFDFVYLDKTDGESISRAIIECLAKRGIDITKARGQAYDGASAMSSPRVGVQARIRALAPTCIICPLQQPRLESVYCFVMPNPSNKEHD